MAAFFFSNKQNAINKQDAIFHAIQVSGVRLMTAGRMFVLLLLSQGGATNNIIIVAIIISKCTGIFSTHHALNFRQFQYCNFTYRRKGVLPFYFRRLGSIGFHWKWFVFAIESVSLTTKHLQFNICKCRNTYIALNRSTDPQSAQVVLRA